MNRGKLYIVATPIGNLTDLSQRAQATLSQVAWIAAENPHYSKRLLEQLGSTAKLLCYHQHNERQKIETLILRLQSGEEGALISDAGTPLISDPGFHLVKAAHQAEIPVIPIPGPCAAITALSASGLATDRFLFEGFLPAKSAARLSRLAKLVNFPHTVIFYEAPHRILALLEDCLRLYEPTREACLARELTKKFEMIYLGDVQTICQKLRENHIPHKGEFVFMVQGWDNTLDEKAQQVDKILKILLAELPLSQAVQMGAKLTDLPKNQLYQHAMRLQKNTP